MNRNDYISCLLDTTVGYSPQYVKEIIVEILGSNGAIAKDIYNNGKPILTHDEIITSCIISNPDTINLLEKWEFERSYRYSVLATYDGINYESFKKLIPEGKILEFSDQTVDHVEAIPNIPTCYQKDDMMLLKLNFLFEAIDPLTGKKRKMKYPLVIAFFLDLGIVEIRFDRIYTIFKDTIEFNEFYKHKIRFATSWIMHHLHVTVDTLSLETLINDIYNKKPEGVIVSAASLSMKQGSKAILEVGANEKDVLPLLGDLELLIEENTELFKRSKEIKDLLDNFILEIKETAELPWASLCWKKRDTGIKKITVKFVHRYAKSAYTLLQHQEELRSMERMNYVARYLIDYRKMSTTTQTTELEEDTGVAEVAMPLSQ